MSVKHEPQSTTRLVITNSFMPDGNLQTTDNNAVQLVWYCMQWNEGMCDGLRSGGCERSWRDNVPHSLSHVSEKRK